MFVKCLLIKPCNISHLNYNDIDYIDNIMKYVEEIDLDIDNFVGSISNHLNFDNISDCNINIYNNIFEEEHNYIYDLLCVSSKIKKDNNEELNIKEDINDNNEELNIKEDINDNNKELNEIGMLINSEDIKIFGNVIILKEYIPSLTNEVKFNDMLKEDLNRILYNRKYNNVVIWDDKWSELKIPDLHEYLKIFFDNEEPEIKHINFLMHNIHIFYIEYKYGNKYICGKLLNDIPIEKCLIITLKTNEYIGNIYLDEVKKMIKLSEKLDKYNIPGEFLEDDIAKNGRSIKNTKYKILDKVYHDNQN